MELNKTVPTREMAFPQIIPGETNALGQQKFTVFTGMTLRDYFAAKVLGTLINVADRGEGSWSPVQIVMDSYYWADKMMEARNQKP